MKKSLEKFILVDGHMKRKIGIIGYGYVGKAIHAFFKDHYEVFVYDPYVEGTDSKKDINACDLGVVCVPTPMGKDRSCDISLVDEVVSWLETPLIIIKSTVAVGTTDDLSLKYGQRIVFSPEYCGESTYWSPYSFHTKIVDTPFFTFGGEPRDTSECIDYYLPVAGPTKTYHQTTAEVAEMAKYMENAFYATKIAFCNEMYTICESVGVDWNSVREAWLLDPRINPMHTAVFIHKRGYSGKCLPKDTNELIALAESHGITPHVLEGVKKSNDDSVGKC